MVGKACLLSPRPYRNGLSLPVSKMSAESQGEVGVQEGQVVPGCP